MGSITIIGLGPSNPKHLSLEAYEALTSGAQVILRTGVHPSVAWLEDKGIKFTTCDHFYEEAESFSVVYDKIVEFVLIEAAQRDVVYAVPGSPLVAERTVVLLREKCRAQKVPFTILPGLSFLDLAYVALSLDPITGLRIIDAADNAALSDAGHYPLMITQVYNQRVASELKLTLMEKLADEAPVTLLHNLGLADAVVRQIPLYELDRQAELDHLTSVYIPCLLGEGVMNLSPLVQLVKTLREPGGCPWDREQTHSSIRANMVEEVYEFLEAVNARDSKGMREELGDVLLQVVFHARMAEEAGCFAMQDVIDDVVNKLIHRHPHVFGSVKVANAEEVLVNWEAIKAQEKTERTRILDGVTMGLPALMRAYKIQKKVAKVGFDWANLAPVEAKIREEWKELQKSLAEKDALGVESEAGDLVFAIVNYLRHIGVEAEVALSRTNDKFTKRFNYVEQCVTASARAWQDYSLEELDKFWDEAKAKERAELK